MQGEWKLLPDWHSQWDWTVLIIPDFTLWKRLDSVTYPRLHTQRETGQCYISNISHPEGDWTVLHIQYFTCWGSIDSLTSPRLHNLRESGHCYLLYNLSENGKCYLSQNSNSGGDWAVLPIPDFALTGRVWTVLPTSDFTISGVVDSDNSPRCHSVISHGPNKLFCLDVFMIQQHWINLTFCKYRGSYSITQLQSQIPMSNRSIGSYKCCSVLSPVSI